MMSKIDQVASHIRFGLEQLSARNAHHDFEHLCRHLTRRRICSNVLPSTGPVSAGGDQGRDFETFRTYLESTPIAASTFLGLASTKLLAFACSLNKAITPKIKSDVKTIQSSGNKVEGIHYFCAVDVTTAARHKLKDWAQEKYGVELEIHDGQSISELLSDREVFWIAEKYLSIPSEIYPRSTTEDEEGWYQSFLAQCKEHSPPQSHASFCDIRLAARTALVDEGRRQDLPFWIGLIRPYTEIDMPILSRRAVFEVAVLSLKGLETLEGQEDDLRVYFQMVPRMEEAADLEDASVLLNFCFYACTTHLCNLTVEELQVWWSNLQERVITLLATPLSVNKKAHLLHERGYLCLWVLSPKSREEQLQEALKWWMKLIALVDHAPWFPLEAFADRLTKFISFFSGVAGYDELTHKVDEKLAKRFGAFTAAEKCRDRAIALYEAGNMLGAISHLHQSKVSWFASETMNFSLVSMLLIAQGYYRLGLLLAAKYYALAAASIALNSNDPDLKPLVPKGLEAAAGYDYHLGAWCSFMDMTGMALLNYQFFADVDDDSSQQCLNRLINSIVNVRTASERFAPDLVPMIDSSISKWQLKDLMSELIPLSHEAWDKISSDQILSKVGDALSGPPFEDLGPRRQVVWCELGVTWRIGWANDYATTPIAEGFAAFLQIFLAELANIDLCLLKTEFSIEILTRNTTETRVEFTRIPTMVGREWKVSFPYSATEENSSKPEGLQRAFVIAAVSLLSEVSLLPIKKCEQITKKLFRAGIVSKLLVGQPYEIAYTQFVPPEIFNSEIRKSAIQPRDLLTYNAKEVEELAWRSGPGPGYNEKAAKKWTRNRYALLKPPILHTLQRLREDVDFMAVVKRLRNDGWLDWHILSAINGVTLNYRCSLHPTASQDPELLKKIFGEMMRKEESPNDVAVPVSRFTEENLRHQLRINMLSALKNSGLECRQKHPDFPAIDHFLGSRYAYWTYDIEHEAIWN